MSIIKITHIITGLNMGGAETMLYKLLKYGDKKKYKFQVISMMDEGIYGDKIKELGIEVISLNMKQGRPSLKGFIKAKKAIKNTDIIQTWMYHADLFGYLLYKTSKVKKIIWGIRRNNLDPSLNKKSTIYIAKLNSLLSRKVDTVVSCSIKAEKTHVNFGYSKENMQVIPNGFEMEKYKPIKSAKAHLSKLVDLPTDIPYILHVGRWNELKDHKNFLKSLKLLREQDYKFQAILVGPNIDEQNIELISLIKNFNLSNYVNLLGRREDIATIMSGSDLFVSSSIDEGFPNVIGEAMACETPCVVTDAGDSGYVVGDTGIIVPPKDSEALAKGIMKMLNYTDEEREKIGRQARQRVIENFDIQKIARQFERLYNI